MRLSFAPGDFRCPERSGPRRRSTSAASARARAGRLRSADRVGKLVVVAAEEELGRGALREEAIGVVSPAARNWADPVLQPSNARIAAADAQANLCAEGESREENGTMELRVEPVEGGAHVFLLAVAVVLSLAEPRRES